MAEGDDHEAAKGADAPNERRLSFHYDDWKEALRDFLQRSEGDEPKKDVEAEDERD